MNDHFDNTMKKSRKNILAKFGNRGNETYVVKDCPFYVPASNSNFFDMQDTANHDAYADFDKYGNAAVLSDDMDRTLRRECRSDKMLNDIIHGIREALEQHGL